MQELEFENIYGISAIGDNLIVIREEEGSEAETFNGKDWEVTVILTRKQNFIPGWYASKHDLEHPTGRNDWMNGKGCGVVTELCYYTQEEIDGGEVPDSDDLVRVKVVPYDES